MDRESDRARSEGKWRVSEVGNSNGTGSVESGFLVGSGCLRSSKLFLLLKSVRASHPSFVVHLFEGFSLVL